MQCRRFEDLILEYCEDAISAEDRGRVEMHLEECADCRAFFEIQRFLAQEKAKQKDKKA